MTPCIHVSLYICELVDWINQDSNFPREVKSHSEILSYFRTNPCPESISVPVIKRALSVF
ncbi:YozE family protein, partial [Staphylococcus aureus]